MKYLVQVYWFVCVCKLSMCDLQNLSASIVIVKEKKTIVGELN